MKITRVIALLISACAAQAHDVPTGCAEDANVDCIEHHFTDNTMNREGCFPELALGTTQTVSLTIAADTSAYDVLADTNCPSDLFDWTQIDPETISVTKDDTDNTALMESADDTPAADEFYVDHGTQRIDFFAGDDVEDYGVSFKYLDNDGSKLYTGVCKISCGGMATRSCSDFSLPYSLRGSPCIGSREYIKAGIPTQIFDLKPSNYEEITDDAKSCVPNSTTGTCRRINFGNLVNPSGDRLTAPDGYFNDVKAVFGAMDFRVNGELTHHETDNRKPGVLDATTPLSNAAKVTSVSIEDGDEVEEGDELYKYCRRTAVRINNGTSTFNCSDAQLTTVTAPFSGVILTAPQLSHVYLHNTTAFNQETPAKCGLGCHYGNPKMHDMEIRVYALLSDTYSAQIGFNRYFSSSTTGVQFHAAAKNASSLIMRANCLYADCRVDDNENRPDEGDPSTSGNPRVSRSFAIGAWDSTSVAYSIGPLEGLGDWLNKVDVDTITIDFSFDTDPLSNNICPYSPDSGAVHPKDHELYCAPEDGITWDVTYTAPIKKPASNNCCTGYKSYSCSLSEPTESEWEGFSDAAAVKTWYETTERRDLTYVDHLAASIGSLVSSCPEGTVDSGSSSNTPCWWLYDDPQDGYVDGYSGSSWRSIRQYNSQSDCEKAVNSIHGGWQITIHSYANSTDGGGTGNDCHSFRYSGSPAKYTEFVFFPVLNADVSSRPSKPSTYAKTGNSRYPSEACPLPGEHDYSDDADCDGLAADSDDNTPSSFWNTRSLFGATGRVARSSNTQEDKCRFAPSAEADGCPLGITYREVGVEYPDPVPPVEEPEPPVVVPPAVVEPEDNIGVCSYEPVSLEGEITVELNVLEGDWDLCAWDGNWADIQEQGYDNPQLDCAGVPDFLIWAKSASGGNEESESFVVENGLDGISVCVVPYNDKAKQCRGNCFSGPIYAAHNTIAIDDSENDTGTLTWHSNGDGPDGWFHELQNPPSWADKVVAVTNVDEGDMRLKLFLAEGVSQPPDPIVLGNVEVGTSSEIRTGLWQIDVTLHMLYRLGVDTSE